jgi:hypothetical protein
LIFSTNLTQDSPRTFKRDWTEAKAEPHPFGRGDSRK